MLYTRLAGSCVCGEPVPAGLLDTSRVPPASRSLRSTSRLARLMFWVLLRTQGATTSTLTVSCPAPAATLKTSAGSL
jgi:hypothetical protein